MKTIMILIISFLSVNLYAPPSPAQITKEQSYQFQILTNPAFRIYYPLIKAIVYVESRGNDSAYNPKENAVGAFQIRECRINHYNRLTGKNYTHDEMYEYDKALEVFLYFCKDRDYEAVAKSWNGSGKLTVIYWDKVKHQLTSQL